MLASNAKVPLVISFPWRLYLLAKPNSSLAPSKSTKTTNNRCNWLPNSNGVLSGSPTRPDSTPEQNAALTGRKHPAALVRPADTGKTSRVRHEVSYAAPVSILATFRSKHFSNHGIVRPLHSCGEHGSYKWSAATKRYSRLKNVIEEAIAAGEEAPRLKRGKVCWKVKERREQVLGEEYTQTGCGWRREEQLRGLDEDGCGSIDAGEEDKAEERGEEREADGRWRGISCPVWG